MGIGTLLGLGGCATGWPWGEGPDPGAAATVTETEPLAETCRRQFTESLNGTSVNFLGGPTVTREANVVTIRLEAQPTNQDDYVTRRYFCDFEEGKLVSDGPVP